MQMRDSPLPPGEAGGLRVVVSVAAGFRIVPLLRDGASLWADCENYPGVPSFLDFGRMADPIFTILAIGFCEGSGIAAPSPIQGQSARAFGDSVAWPV